MQEQVARKELTYFNCTVGKTYYIPVARVTGSYPG